MPHPPNQEINVKLTATNLKIADKLVPSAVLENSASQDNPERNNLIATGAYYKAEERGFMPGHELDDWLEAETEITTSGEQS